MRSRRLLLATGPAASEAEATAKAFWIIRGRKGGGLVPLRSAMPPSPCVDAGDDAGTPDHRLKWGVP